MEGPNVGTVGRSEDQVEERVVEAVLSAENSCIGLKRAKCRDPVNGLRCHAHVVLAGWKPIGDFANFSTQLDRVCVGVCAAAGGLVLQNPMAFEPIR